MPPVGIWYFGNRLLLHGAEHRRKRVPTYRCAKLSKSSSRSALVSFPGAIWHTTQSAVPDSNSCCAKGKDLFLQTVQHIMWKGNAVLVTCSFWGDTLVNNPWPSIRKASRRLASARSSCMRRPLSTSACEMKNNLSG